MTDAADIPPDGPDMTAAEYALGVLEGDARRAAVVRLASDQGFAAEVADWEQRLAPLAAEIKPVEAPAHVWPRIQASIAAPGMWNSLGFWRGATAIGAIAAAAAITLVVVGPNLTPPPATVAPPTAPAAQPIQVAKLSPKPGEAPTVVATLDPNAGELVLTPVALKLKSTQSPELWVIPKGQEPISLGVMDETKPYRIKLPKELEGEGRLTAVLAVTAEQAGGSPDRKPHGPVITAGGFGEV